MTSIRMRSVVFVTGAAVVVASTILPWLSLELTPDRTAWSMHPSLLWTVGGGPVTWGLLILVLVAAAVLAPARGPEWLIVSRFATVGVLLAPVLAVLQVRYADPAAMHALVTDHAEYAAFAAQLDYAVGSTPLTTFFGLDFSPEWAVVFNAISSGPFAATAGALAMLVSGRRRSELIDAPLAGRTRVAVVSAAVTAAGVLALCPTVSAILVRGADEAVAAGDYARASKALNAAQAWNHGLVADDRWVDDLATVTFAASATATPAGEIQAAHIYAGNGLPSLELRALLDAYAGDRHNPVVRDRLVLAAVISAARAKRADYILALPAPLRKLPLVEYTLARVYFDAGLDLAAERLLMSVTQADTSGDMLSSAWTFLGLSLARRGLLLKARDAMQRALHYDFELENTQAAAYAAGLYELNN